MISIINEGIKEHFKKHGRKYLAGAAHAGAAASAGLAWHGAHETDEALKKMGEHWKDAKSGLTKTGLGLAGTATGAKLVHLALKKKKKVEK